MFNSKSKLYQDFIKGYLIENLIAARKLAFFALFFYLIFSGLDAYIAGSFFSEIVYVRLAITVLMFAIILLSYLSYFISHWQKLFCVYIIVAGVGVIILTTYINCPLKSLYAQGLLLVIFYGYTMNRLLLVSATISGITISVIYAVTAFNCEEISQQTLITSLFFQVAANINLADKYQSSV